jgi:hypothetical protein
MGQKLSTVKSSSAHAPPPARNHQQQIRKASSLRLDVTTSHLAVGVSASEGLSDSPTRLSPTRSESPRLDSCLACHRTAVLLVGVPCCHPIVCDKCAAKNAKSATKRCERCSEAVAFYLPQLQIRC